MPRGLTADIVDGSVSLTTSLRQAKVLAYSLGADRFREWVDHELKGYAEDVEAPGYRYLRIPPLGTFLSRVGLQVKNQMIPLDEFPEEVRERLANVVWRNPVGEIESTVATGDSSLRLRWPAELIRLAPRFVQMSGGLTLVDGWWPVPSHVLQRVLDPKLALTAASAGPELSI